MKKEHFIKCIKSYFDNEYDVLNKESRTPKISVYYMIGYLSIALGIKKSVELEEYIEKIMKKRY